ncbi:MAG: hypothetical protein A3E83_00680 [Gammaproteobacteria bacterium RIFCSPHIGHO2_12_FULL_41_20]|nr:MAG: hypothetical protein A3E83_00680 [Gammaproteobacteria bacterium RIFCSPHIGHO2_12_FULL_41_20]
MEYKKWFTFCVIFIFVSPVYAEYYLVYSESEPIATCSYNCGRVIVKKHKYHKKVAHKQHYTKAPYNKKNSYSITVYCPCSNMWIPSDCSCCSGIIYQTRGYTVSPAPPRHDSYVMEEYVYDPDLSTADDNAITNPGMNIDN